MSGVQAAYGSAPSAVPTNLDEITDEELLRQLWQEADNYSERRRIRARMYKLREKRLREMVQNDEESLGCLTTTDQGTYRIEKSEANVTVTSPPRKSSNIEINLQVRGDSAVTDSISMHNVKLGGLTMRGIGSKEPKRPPSDEEIIDEKVEETKKTRNDRFNKIMSMYEENPADEAIVSISKSTYSVQNNALAGDSYQSMKHKEVRDSASPTRYDYSRRIAETNRDIATSKAPGQDSSDDNSKSSKKQPSSYGRKQQDATKRVTSRRLSKELQTFPITAKNNSKVVGKQNAETISAKGMLKAARKPLTKGASAKNEYNKLDSYLNTCTDPNDELITEEEEVVEDESGNIVKMLVQTRRKKDGTEYMSRRVARTTKVVDNEKDINEILIGNPDHEIIHRNVEETEEDDGSKLKIISETRRRPDGIEYQTRNILKTSKIFDYDHPENVCYSEDDELIDTKETKEVDENGVEILSVTETRRKSTGEKYTTKKVYKTSKVTAQISPSSDDEILDRKVTEETSQDGTNIKVVIERRRTQKGEEYTHKQVFKARKMTLSDIELLKGMPTLTSEDELVDKKENEETDEVGNTVKKVTETRKKKDGSQYSFDYVIRSVKGTEKDINEIPYNVCESSKISTNITDELIKEDVKEELQADGSTVKTIIERRKANDGTEYLRHRIIRIPKLPEPELQVASKDDELLEEDINEDILDDGTQFRAITERRRSSVTGLQYTLRRMSKVFHPTIHLFGVDEIIDENVTEEETSDGVLTRTVIRRYQRPDDSVYTTHNVSKTYKNPIQVMPDECSNDELVDRSYDVRETNDGFLIRTVMETRCRTDGVHYTVERTEKISKNKSTLKSSTAENDALLTGSPGDTVISREQHEEPGEVGIIIKTVLEVRKRKDGTEYTNKATVKTTQILVPEHETSYVIIKPDPKNASGKDFMPSLNDEIIYTRNKEEVDDKGNTLNVIIETRKNSSTGEKYNLTKRVRTTDVVMTEQGEKVLSKNIHRDEVIPSNKNLFDKGGVKQGANKPTQGTSSINITDRKSTIRTVKDEVRVSPIHTKASSVHKNRSPDTKNLKSTTEGDRKSESLFKKTKDTKRSVFSRNQVKDRITTFSSNTKNSHSRSKSPEPITPTKKTTSDVNKKIKNASANKRSSGSSSETTSDSNFPERSNVTGKNSSLSKKRPVNSQSSDEGKTPSNKSVKKVSASTRSYSNKTSERKEVTSRTKQNKIDKSDRDSAKCIKTVTSKTRSSDEDSNNESRPKDNRKIKSASGLKIEKKSTPREVVSKSNSYTGTSSTHSEGKTSTVKRNSLPGEDIPLTVKSTNEKALNYMNLVRKRNSKGTIEKVEERTNRSDSSKTRSTNKTSAIRDKYSTTTTPDNSSKSKKRNDYVLDKSILSQIIPDTPMPSVNNKPETPLLPITDRIKDNVSSKRSMFEKYSDVKTIETNSSIREHTPVIEPVIVPKYIEPMCTKDRAASVDLTNMKSKDLKLASTKLVRDTMHSESNDEREESPAKEYKIDLSDRGFSPKRSSITETDFTASYTSLTANKKISTTSSVDSFNYERRDSECSFAKEGSPSRFVTGKPIDQGVNTNKIKKLERAGSHKKLLVDVEPSSTVTMSFTQDVDTISDLTQLENMLNRAESYEERRILRGRIRNVKRANQSQQTSRSGRATSDKYSFKSPSNLSPQIQRRSNQFTGQPTYGKEERGNAICTKREAMPSTASKSASSISKNVSESSTKQTEIRKISSSSVTSTEEKSENILERKSFSAGLETKRKSSAEDRFSKAQRPTEESQTKGTSGSALYSRSNFESTSHSKNYSEKRDSLEHGEESVEKVKTKPGWKKQPYSEPLRHQKVKSELSEKHQTDVEKIISPYGVGPTDENGIPLFGLRALKRRNKPTDCHHVEESMDEVKKPSPCIRAEDVAVVRKRVSIEEHEEIAAISNLNDTNHKREDSTDKSYSSEDGNDEDLAGRKHKKLRKKADRNKPGINDDGTSSADSISDDQTTTIPNNANLNSFNPSHIRETFETDSLNMDPDSLSECEDEEEKVRSKNFRNIVKLHESKVDRTPSAEPSSPPKQKLRQEFISQEDQADHKAYKTWDLQTDLVSRSEAVENIIAKHETFTTKEGPKAGKRLTGILKKSTSSLSSKVADEREMVTEDVEEQTERKYSSEISSDFCGTKDSGRKSSFAEVTLTTQPKASKKKKQGLLDKHRQGTNKTEIRKEYLTESTSSDYEKISEKSKKNIYTGNKNKSKKQSKPKKTKTDIHYNTEETNKETSSINKQLKLGLDRSSNIENKSLYTKSSKGKILTAKKEKREHKEETNIDVSKQTEVRKSSVVIAESSSVSTSKKKSNISRGDIKAQRSETIIPDQHDTSTKEQIKKRGSKKTTVDKMLDVSLTTESSITACKRLTESEKTFKGRKRTEKISKGSILVDKPLNPTKHAECKKVRDTSEDHMKLEKAANVCRNIKKSIEKHTNVNKASKKHSHIEEDSATSCNVDKISKGYSKKKNISTECPMVETTEKEHIKIDKNSQISDKKRVIKISQHQEIAECTKMQTQRKNSMKHKSDSVVLKANKMVSQETPRSAKLVSKVQHDLESNSITKFGRKDARKDKKSSGMLNKSISLQTTKTETMLADDNIKSTKRSKNIKQDTCHRENTTHSEKQSKETSVKQTDNAISTRSVKEAAIAQVLSEKQNITSKVTKANLTSTLAKENQATECSLSGYNESVSNTIATSDDTRITETATVLEDKSQHNYIVQSSTDQNISSVSQSIIRVPDTRKNEDLRTVSSENIITSRSDTTSIKPFSPHNVDSVRTSELTTSLSDKNKNKVIDSTQASCSLMESKVEDATNISLERTEVKRKTKKGSVQYCEQTNVDDKIKTEKSEKARGTINSASKMSKQRKDIVSMQKVGSAKSETNDLETIKRQESSKSPSKEIPSYMRPKSTCRRRSTPEKEPEELENILLNSYIYTRCTKKTPILPVSYDYTYVVNKDSASAGSNGDSYSVYFGPRDNVPSSVVQKRSSIISDTLSITEEKNLTDHRMTDNVRRDYFHDDTSCSSVVNLPDENFSKSDQYILHEDINFSKIQDQHLSTVENVDMHLEEEHSEKLDTYEIFEENTFSQQENLRSHATDNQKAVYLTVPEVETTQIDRVLNTNGDKFTSLSEKELQQKYNYQVERKAAEIFEENQRKEVILTSSDNEHSTTITDKFNVDFNKVYADRMAKYYQTNAKNNDTMNTMLNLSEEKVNIHSEEKSESFHFAAQSSERVDHNDSYYITFDGRPAGTKPLSDHPTETSSHDRPTCPTEVKEIVTRISHNEESGVQDEYSRTFDSSAEVRVEKDFEMTDDKSFLNDRTKVTGISDVLSRMGATETVDHEAPVTSDDQARSLLNRFLGAQVLMTGVESMMAQSAPSQNRSPAAFGKGITKVTPANANNTSSRVQQSTPDIIQGVNINEVNDSFELNELLDSCEGYDERRRIRLRLKDVVAQEKESGDIIGLKKVTSTTRRIAGSKVATVGSSEGKGTSAFNKFKQIDGQQSRTTSGPQVAGPLFALSTSLNRSASGVKDMIMTWCQCRTRNYKGVKIENFSTSWNDGLAFCALIHHFYPDAFNFDALNPKNRRYNFALAFRTADERADVYPLLDVEDMVAMQKPDWKCVFTYVQTLYKRLKDE